MSGVPSGVLRRPPIIAWTFVSGPTNRSRRTASRSKPVEFPGGRCAVLRVVVATPTIWSPPPLPLWRLASGQRRGSTRLPDILPAAELLPEGAGAVFTAEIAPSDGGPSLLIARSGQAAIHPISVFMGSRSSETPKSSRGTPPPSVLLQHS